MMKDGDILTLRNVLGRSSLVMTQKHAHFSSGHMVTVVSLNLIVKINGTIQDDANANANQEGE